jgi:hypothetical protein
MSDKSEKTTLGGTLINSGMATIGLAAAALLVAGITTTTLIAGGIVILSGMGLIMFGVRLLSLNAADKDETVTLNQIKPLPPDEPIKPKQLIEPQVEKREPPQL